MAPYPHDYVEKGANDESPILNAVLNVANGGQRKWEPSQEEETGRENMARSAN